MRSLLFVILLSFYTLASFSAFVAFVVMKNHAAATWAFVTGIISAITLHLRWLKHRNKFNEWYDEELPTLRFTGFWCFTIGFAGFVYHLVVELQGKIPIVPVAESQIIAMVWAFMFAKSGIYMLCAARPDGYNNAAVVNERSSLIGGNAL